MLEPYYQCECGKEHFLNTTDESQEVYCEGCGKTLDLYVEVSYDVFCIGESESDFQTYDDD